MGLLVEGVRQVDLSQLLDGLTSVHKWGTHRSQLARYTLSTGLVNVLIWSHARYHLGYSTSLIRLDHVIKRGKPRSQQVARSLSLAVSAVYTWVVNRLLLLRVA